MKRALLIGFITLVVVGISLFWVTRNAKAPVSTPGEQIKIITSIPLLKNMAEQIGGAQVHAESIVKGAACAHDYEPSTEDMRQVADSDILIKAGLNFDYWFDKLARTAGEQTVLIDASLGVCPLGNDGKPHECETDEECHAHNHQHEHAHNLGNPHYWGNPENVKIIAGNILVGLNKVRPDKKRIFTENYTRFIEELKQTSVELREKIIILENRTIVSYSAAFPYFFTYFGFKNLGTVETTCEQEVSPKRLMEIAKLMEKENVTVIVGEEVYPEYPEVLAKETGAKTILLWPTTLESGDYLETLKINVEKMVSALQ